MNLEELKIAMIEKLNNIEQLQTSDEKNLANEDLKEEVVKQLDKLNSIKNDFILKLNEVSNMKEINDIRIEFLGKKGPITELYSLIGSFDNEQKKQFGKLINNFKSTTTNVIEQFIKYFKEEEINQKLASEQIDISLPATKVSVGVPHVLEKLIEEIEEIFISMGYDVVDGPEVEKDLYNFEMLNIPKGHPARDAQDTFYIEGEEILLRSQTSPVQVRTMLKSLGKEPIRMICPGKTYRRDDDDATHSHQFVQIEGLLVDKDISLSDLKGTIDNVVKKLFSEDIKTRFRPSYYQFTEPSVEVDISCFNCKGKGCNICKNTGWITIAGAGIVHPNVLSMSGYDPKVWSGFAFGFGAERMAMLKYDINDLRVFYNTDLREIKIFDRKELNNND